MPINDAVIPTIFLHGFSGEGDGLRQFADVYSGKEAICINMPGFGGTDAPVTDLNEDIREYCSDVWREIRKAAPEGSVNLVGHSHGAMIGYVLAVQHPDEVARLDLFCPVARPRFIPRISIGAIRYIQAFGVPPSVIIRFMSRPFLVSLVTRYTFHPDWSTEDRQRIIKMRKRESQFYSPIMLDLMKQTSVFTKVMEGTHCSVPTQICYVSDENVASDDDYKWYEAHANIKKVKEISGGHLCVVANPLRVVEAFRYEGA